jgi:hypothetical protein
MFGYFKFNNLYFSLPRGVYPSRISWNDPTTLVIACAKTIKIVTIATEPSQEHQSTAPRKYMNTGLKFSVLKFRLNIYFSYLI